MVQYTNIIICLNNKQYLFHFENPKLVDLKLFIGTHDFTKTLYSYKIMISKPH